jgi:MarR-like DNA-binding transcriptional regulator SgrR of sgrS sRNA
MTDLHVDHGCYVVLWPDVEPWKGNDSRRSVVAALDQNAVIDELDRQAQDLRQEGINVEVVHLGIEYQRPDRSLLRRLASISSRLFPPRGSVASF